MPLSLFDLFHDPEATPVSQAPPRGHGDGCYSTCTVRTSVLGSLLCLAQSPVSSLPVAGRENARTSLSLTFRYLKESNVPCFRGVLSVSQGSRARRGYMGQGTGCRVCVCPSRTFQLCDLGRVNALVQVSIFRLQNKGLDDTPLPRSPVWW